MSTEGDAVSGINGRATTLQVYDLVNQTRLELVGRINDLRGTVETTALAQEHRLTTVEQQVTTLASTTATKFAEQDKQLCEHDTTLNMLRTTDQTDKAIEGAINKARTIKTNWHQWAIGIAALVLVSAPQLINLFIHL